MTAERYALGVDVGGTFTDLALVRLSDKKIFYHKTPSTPEDPSLAVTQGIKELIIGAETDFGAVTYFGHVSELGHRIRSRVRIGPHSKYQAFPKDFLAFWKKPMR